MVSISDEIIKSKDVLAFKKVIKDIPSASKRVEISYCAPEYEIKTYLPGLMSYKLNRKNHLIEIDAICLSYKKGGPLLLQVHETIELPIKNYCSGQIIKRQDHSLTVKLREEE